MNNGRQTSPKLFCPTRPLDLVYHLLTSGGNPVSSFRLRTNCFCRSSRYPTTIEGIFAQANSHYSTINSGPDVAKPFQASIIPMFCSACTQFDGFPTAWDQPAGVPCHPSTIGYISTNLLLSGRSFNPYDLLPFLANMSSNSQADSSRLSLRSPNIPGLTDHQRTTDMTQS